MDNKNLENPYVGIFPTKEQHQTIIKDFLDKHKYAIAGNIYDKINELRDYEIFHYYRWVQIINKLNHQHRDHILDSYKKLGFNTQRHQYYFQDIEIIGNFNNFKSKLSYQDDEGRQLLLNQTEEDEFFGKEYNITPGIFHMGEMFINSENNEITVDFINKNGISKYSINDGELKTRAFPARNIVSPKVGWTNNQLKKALSDAGIFDTEVEESNVNALEPYLTNNKIYDYKKGKYVTISSKNNLREVKLYKHSYHNLKKYGIPFEYYHGSKIPGYDMYNLTKSMLENLYRLIFKPQPDWKEVCTIEDIDGPSINIEYERRTGKRLISDNKNVICSILGQRFSEVPQISQQIILQPPSKTAAGIQYLKYLNDPTASSYALDKRFNTSMREISMSDYQSFYDICRDPNKDRFVALLHANRLGIELNFNETTTKEDICKVIDNHLRIIKEGRKL